MSFDSSRCGACSAEYGDGTTEETLLDGLTNAGHFFARFLVCKQNMILEQPIYNGRFDTTAMQPMQAELIRSCIGTWQFTIQSSLAATCART